MMAFSWTVLALLVPMVVGQSNGTYMEEAGKSAMKTGSSSLSWRKCGIRPFDKRNIYSQTFRVHKQAAYTDYRDDDDSDDNDHAGDDSDFVEKIVGGEYATYGEFPWQASVEVVVFNERHHYCGATILNEHWLLSAANCFEKYPASTYVITVGNHKHKYKDAWEQAFTVQKIISHNLYKAGDPDQYDHDIALIKIKPSANGQGIRFSDYVQPACLPDSRPDITDDTRPIVSGWGAYSEDGKSSDILKKAEMPLVSRQKCKQILSSYSKFLTKRMICAGHLQGGTGACFGDSGGGLMYKPGGTYTILGIASWITDTPCGKANASAVFAYVPEFLTWISSTIQRHSHNQAESDLPSRP